MADEFVFYEVYPGDLSGFLALMENLLSRFDNVIGFEDDLLRIVHDERFRTPQREVWKISHLLRVEKGELKKTDHQGLIIAREEENNQTVVEFIDGYTWYKLPGLPVQGQNCSQIGVGFDRLVKRITDEWA